MEITMKNKNKYFFKAAVMGIMAIMLMLLSFYAANVSNVRDFLAGLAMGGIMVSLLGLVYSVIRSLCGKSD